MNLNNLTTKPMAEPISGGAAKNVLANDVEIKGTIKFENELIFDGKVEGEILSEGSLVIGKNAEVRGEVKTKSVTVHGTVFGNITVTEKAELKASSQLTGDLKATHVRPDLRAWFVHHLAFALMVHLHPRVPVVPYRIPRSALVVQAVWFLLRGMGLEEATIRRHYRPETLSHLLA